MILRFLADMMGRVLRHRDIIIDDELYLRRLYLTPRTWPLRVFLHFIFRDDEGRNLHDHPWDFWSLILFRHYDEMLPSGIRKHHWLSWIAFKAEHSHRVLIKRPAVSLCFVKAARRDWGFFDDDGKWIMWREHLGLSEEEHPTPLEDQWQRSDVA